MSGWIDRNQWSIAAVICAAVLGVLFGSLVFGGTETVDSSTVPTLATVTLAPDGSAYCPADPSVSHPTPCVFQPTTTQP